MASNSNCDNTITLYYGNKDWFVSICGLNGHGKIPGQTLTESDISKQDCVDMFGDKKSNNGFKTSRCPPLVDRVNWLWKRVHQVDKPVNNDVGFHFCQGLLYEERHGLGTVDWAELAVTTVNWFKTTKGTKKVHPDWAHACPSITMDIFTRQPDDGKRKRVEDSRRHSTSASERKPRKSNSNRVKAEYFSPKVSNSYVEISEIQGAKIQDPEIQYPEEIQGPEIQDPGKMQGPGIQAPQFQDPETVAPGIPTSETEAPEGCNPMPLEGTPSFLSALHLFQIDIQQAIDASIKSLEEHKEKLTSILGDTGRDVELSTATVKILKEELETANLALSKCDSDETRGEVRCMQSAVKAGETRLNSKKAKYDGVLKDWRLHMKVLTEKCQAQKVLETHFRLKDEEDRMWDVTGK